MVEIVAGMAVVYELFSIINLILKVSIQHPMTTTSLNTRPHILSLYPLLTLIIKHFHKIQIHIITITFSFTLNLLNFSSHPLQLLFNRIKFWNLLVMMMVICRSKDILRVVGDGL